MMEIYFLPELREVLASDLQIDLLSDLVLAGDHFQLVLHLIDLAIIVQVVFRIETIGVGYVLLVKVFIFIVVALLQSERINRLALKQVGIVVV